MQSLALPCARQAHSRIAGDIVGAIVLDYCIEICGNRDAGVYLAHVACRLPIKTLARLIDRATPTVRRILMAIEDRRDAAEFDAWLNQLTDEVSQCSTL